MNAIIATVYSPAPEDNPITEINQIPVAVVSPLIWLLELTNIELTLIIEMPKIVAAEIK